MGYNSDPLLNSSVPEKVLAHVEAAVASSVVVRFGPNIRMSTLAPIGVRARMVASEHEAVARQSGGGEQPTVEEAVAALLRQLREIVAQPRVPSGTPDLDAGGGAGSG